MAALQIRAIPRYRCGLRLAMESIPRLSFVSLFLTQAAWRELGPRFRSDLWCGWTLTLCFGAQRRQGEQSLSTLRTIDCGIFVFNPPRVTPMACGPLDFLAPAQAGGFSPYLHPPNGLNNSAKSPSVNSGCLRAAQSRYMLSASAALRFCRASMRSSMVPWATSL
jgi:hypothetical protein